MTSQDATDTPKVRQLRPESSHAERDGATSSRSTRSSHRTSRRRSTTARTAERRVQQLTLALIGTVLGIIVVLITGALYVRDVTDSSVLIDQQARRLQREVTDLSAKVQSLAVERDELVAGRIPGLRRLDFDQTIDIGQYYVRNISFTLTSTNAEQAGYEFRVVLSNDTLNTVVPGLRVVIFDELGIQIGMWDITAADAETTIAASHTLESGEVRSYTSTIPRTNQTPAVYFQVFVD